MRIEYIFLILAMGIVTYLTRVSFLVLSKNVVMPKTLTQSLKYIPPAILATLIFPGVLAPQGKLFITLTNPYLWASLITVLVILLLKNPVLSIVLGIFSLMAIKFFI